MKMVYVLFAAVAAGAAIGGVRSLAGSSTPTPAAEPAPVVAAETPAPAMEQAAEGAAVEGEVLEAIDVPNYTYLRVGKKGSEGTWIAVPTTGTKPGEHVRLENGMKMTAFTSAVLKRTFPVIYFGSLEGKGPAATAGSADGADPHAKAGKPAVDARPVEKAKGDAARTVAETIAQRAQLSGKMVRIHGTVVKMTPGIMGKTYLHLRDGSGDAAAGTNDVTVTTTATPSVGEVVTVEGTVVLDRDIGSGYKFPTLVDDAKVLPQ